MDASKAVKALAVRALLLLSVCASTGKAAPDFEAAVVGAGAELQASFDARAAQRKAAPAALRYDEACILRAVAGKMGVTLRPEVPVPPVFLGSRTPLVRFQDAVEPQWNMRPEAFLNVYVIRNNEIYLNDDASLYASHGRALDDSLAHEFAHYIQVRYQGADFARDDGDALESGAVAVQFWFRENYIARPGTCS